MIVKEKDLVLELRRQKRHVAVARRNKRRAEAMARERDIVFRDLDRELDYAIASDKDPKDPLPLIAEEDAEKSNLPST